MNTETHQKVTASHLKRGAYLYVRQSTLRQVIENTESTDRQYALRQRAIALGWPNESVIVIDSDLGQSGASAVDREGFHFRSSSRSTIRGMPEPALLAVAAGASSPMDGSVTSGCRETNGAC